MQEVEQVGGGPSDGRGPAGAREPLHDPVPGDDGERAVGDNDRVLKPLDQTGAEVIHGRFYQYNRGFGVAGGITLATPNGDGKPLMALDGMRILLVEDAADIREVFTVLLRAEGADVTATGTGREAAEIAGRRDFDVVLSDLGLPDIPGDVLIRQILSNSRNRRTRVMVVTGYGEPYLTRAHQAGADVVFTKPVEWSRILEYLERPGLAASA